MLFSLYLFFFSLQLIEFVFKKLLEMKMKSKNEPPKLEIGQQVWVKWLEFFHFFFLLFLFILLFIYLFIFFCIQPLNRPNSFWYPMSIVGFTELEGKPLVTVLIESGETKNVSLKDIQVKKPKRAIGSILFEVYISYSFIFKIIRRKNKIKIK